MSDTFGAVVLVGSFLLISLAFRYANTRIASRPVPAGRTRRGRSTTIAAAGGQCISRPTEYVTEARTEPSLGRRTR